MVTEIYDINAQCYWRYTGRKALPYWATPLSKLYYTTVVVPYQEKLAKRKHVQKQDVINEILGSLTVEYYKKYSQVA